jgi:hypothetical protein
MRFTDFKLLPEASIQDAKYGEGHQLILSSSKMGKQVAAAILKIVPGFAVDQPITKTLAGAGPKIQIGTGNAITVKLKDANNKQIQLVGPASLGDGFNHYKSATSNGTTAAGVANRGEIAEGILGAAMVAKFAKRTTTGIGEIAVGDVTKVLGALGKSGKDEYTTSIAGRDGANKDILIFVLKLKTVPYKDLMDPAKRDLLADLFSSAVQYANGSMTTRYAEYFYQNHQDDMIKVISDGVTGEASRKTDVYVEVESPIGSTPRTTKLDISLKAGPVKQFGQVGGTGFNKLVELFTPFGIDISEYEDEYTNATDKTEALSMVYAGAAELMTQHMAGDKREEQFIREVFKGINYFGTLNNPNVRLVQFDKGTYSVVDFNRLHSIVEKINLVATVKTDSTGKPQIHVVDANSGERFLTFRAKIENKVDKAGKPYQYFRNIIEKESLLSNLAKVKG